MYDAGFPRKSCQTRSSLAIMRSDEFVEVQAFDFGLRKLEHALESGIAEAHALICDLGDNAEGTVEDERVKEHGVIAKFAFRALRRGYIEGGCQDRWLAFIFHHTVRQLQPTFFAALGDDFVLEAGEQMAAGLPGLGARLKNGLELRIDQFPRIHGLKLG